MQPRGKADIDAVKDAMRVQRAWDDLRRTSSVSIESLLKGNAMQNNWPAHAETLYDTTQPPELRSGEWSTATDAAGKPVRTFRPFDDSKEAFDKRVNDYREAQEAAREVKGTE